MTRTPRPCYICGQGDNPVIASEPVEHRFGKPVLPEGVYNFARCRRCSTLYVDSDVTDEYIAALYRDESDAWASELVGDPKVHAAMKGGRLVEFEKHWARLKRLRAPAPGDCLLDVGCQAGDFGSVARRDGVRPHGVELARDYAAACRRRWEDDAAVHCGPIAAAPFRAGQFQYVTSFETLEHMRDPIGALRALRPLLAEGGVLAISVPSSDYFHLKYWLLRSAPLAPLWRRALGRRWAFYQQQILPHTHIYNFSLTSIVALLRRAGFRAFQVGLTGWHGRSRVLLDVAGRALGAASGARIALAPSLFAVARRADEGGNGHA